jgi:hypothetical protein
VLITARWAAGRNRSPEAILIIIIIIIIIVIIIEKDETLKGGLWC